MKLIKKKDKKPIRISTQQINVEIQPFSIIIPFSINKFQDLDNCLFYLNQCKGISKCEIVIVLYQNENISINFDHYKNLNYKIIHSKRNNAENIFCLSHARNIGLMNSKYNWNLCIDCDILFENNLCQNLSFERKDDILYWTARYNVANFGLKQHLSQMTKYLHYVDQAPYGYFHFFNKQIIFDRVGGYDENMYGWGAEDNDFVNRCRLAKIDNMNIKDYVHCFHRIHPYDNQWKNNENLHNNSSKESFNQINSIIKINNVGKIL